MLAGVTWWSCWYGQLAKAAGGVPWRSYWYGLPAEAAGGSAAGEMERSGSLCGKACRWASDYAAASWKSLPLGERRRCGKGKVQSSIGKRLSSLGKVQSSIGKRLNGRNQHFTPFLFQCHRPHIAIPIITKYNSAA